MSPTTRGGAGGGASTRLRSAVEFGDPPLQGDRAVALLDPIFEHFDRYVGPRDPDVDPARLAEAVPHPGDPFDAERLGVRGSQLHAEPRAVLPGLVHAEEDEDFFVHFHHGLAPR